MWKSSCSNDGHTADMDSSSHEAAESIPTSTWIAFNALNLKPGPDSARHDPTWRPAGSDRQIEEAAMARLAVRALVTLLLGYEHGSYIRTGMGPEYHP